MTPRTDPESMETSLDCLDLSPRVLNALLAGNCETVGDVVRLGYDKVFMLRNMGAKGLREVAVMLKTQGVHSPEWDLWLPLEPDNRAVMELFR